MPGILHITRLGEERGPYDKLVRHYQASYATPGNSYSRAFDEEKLEEFLRSKVALTPAQIERAFEELHRTGNTTVGEVEISPAEAGAFGLQQNPSDF